MANDLIWHDHPVNAITNKWKSGPNGSKYGGEYTSSSGAKVFPGAPPQLRVRYATRGADDPAYSPGNKTFWQTRIADGAFQALDPHHSADPGTGNTPQQLYDTGYVTPAQIAVD